MPKSKTISARWSDWTKADPFWARLCLWTFIGSILCLGLHLAILEGFLRTAGLVGMIALACTTEGVMCFRAQKFPTVWWWFWFHTYIVAGVIGWEIASYVASSIWGI